MVGKKTNRRQFIKNVALTFSAVGVGLGALRDRAFAASPILGTTRSSQEKILKAMLRPLGPGSKLVGTVVESISVTRKRVGQVQLIDPKSDTLVTVDICRKDKGHSALRAVGQTENYLLFLKNEGDGSKVTPEHVGLSVLALAETIQNREHAFEPLALITEEQHMRLNQ